MHRNSSASGWTHLGATPRLNSYADHDALAKRMQQVNPRLSDEKAAYLARALSRLLDDGRVQMAS